MIHFASYYAAGRLTLLSMFVFREGINNFDTDRCREVRVSLWSLFPTAEFHRILMLLAVYFVALTAAVNKRAVAF